MFAPIPVGYSEIDSLIGGYEADPRRSAALVRARKRMSKAAEQEDLATIASLRLRMGFSQVVLASMIGTSQSRLSRIESGLDDIMHTTFEKLVVALEVTRDELAGALTRSGKIQR